MQTILFALSILLSKIDKKFVHSMILSELSLVSRKCRVINFRRVFLTMGLIICLTLVALTLLLVFLYFRLKFSYFKDRGIDGPKPGIFGNTKEAFLKRKHLTFETGRIYKYLT
jgi:hypothetical protein